MLALHEWQRYVLFLGTVLVTLLASLSEACSCLPQHPQVHFCKADYVILAKVKSKKLAESEAAYTYKVKIRKVFKMSEKANLSLKSGQIWTALNDGVCGVPLRINSKYLLAGSINGNKAWISQCAFYESWSALTAKQKKGFRLLYKQGCDCKITPCWSRQPCRKNHNTCSWNPSPHGGNCERHHAVCTRQATGECDWLKSRGLRDCLKTKEEEHQRRLATEP